MNILLLNILLDFFSLIILLLQIILQRSFVNIIFWEYVHWANSPLGYCCDQKYMFYKIQRILSRCHAERLNVHFFHGFGTTYYQNFANLTDETYFNLYWIVSGIWYFLYVHISHWNIFFYKAPGHFFAHLCYWIIYFYHIKLKFWCMSY